MRALLSCLLLAATPVYATAAHPPGDGRLPTREKLAIKTLLERSATAWSSGDLETFMRLYERGPGTEYVGIDGVVTGSDAIRERYRKNFGEGAQAMGALKLSADEVRGLGASYALVTGHYALERPAGSGRSRGNVFTLVMHRSSAGWGVVSDHSS